MRKDVTFQFAEYRDVFCYFDKKGDGKIAVNQVGDVLRALGENPTEAELNCFCAHFDEDARVLFEEFIPIFITISKNKSKYTAADFAQGLCHFDKEGNGLLNAAELRNILTTVGECLSDEEVDQVMTGLIDHHGNIKIEDFVSGIMYNTF